MVSTKSEGGWSEGTTDETWREAAPLSSGQLFAGRACERREVLLLLADRLTTPVHGLMVSGVVDLFAGRRALDEFGLAHQALLDLTERVSVVSACVLTFSPFACLPACLLACSLACFACC